MTTTTYTIWIEGALILLMLVGMIAVFYERIIRRKGPWTVTIQLLTIIFVFPTIIILALEGKVKEDAAASAKVKDEIVGLDFDPFLNTQDPSPRYVLGNVTAKDDKCSAEIFGVTGGKREKDVSVLPELAFTNGHWIFENFHYPKPEHPEDENLLSVLKALRAGREKTSH